MCQYGDLKLQIVKSTYISAQSGVINSQVQPEAVRQKPGSMRRKPKLSLLKENQIGIDKGKAEYFKK
jgi:hypothetical protein